MIDAELKNLQIDRTRRRSAEPSKWATRWIIAGVVVLLLLGGWRFAAEKFNPAPVVEVQRVRSISAASAPEGVILNATGYIVAAHKIEVAAKVIGRVKWIGVDKGDRVKEGEVLVRLEDDEYQAQLMQAKGQLTSLEAKLAEASGRGRSGAGERQHRAERPGQCPGDARTQQESAQGRSGGQAGCG